MTHFRTNIPSKLHFLACSRCTIPTSVPFMLAGVASAWVRTGAWPGRSVQGHGQDGYIGPRQIMASDYVITSMALRLMAPD